MKLKLRHTIGPALTIALALLAIVGRPYADVTPHLGPAFIAIVAYAAAMSGIVAGLVTAGTAVICAALLMLLAEPLSGLGLPNLLALLLTVAAAIGTALIAGTLRGKVQEALLFENERHAPAERLAAALDRINIGVVLLDRDTRAEFINRAFRNFFRLPDDKANAKPPLIALMYHSRDTRALQLPEDELDGYIARRTEMIRAGDSVTDMQLANGQVLRLTCSALPDGGRMLSYTPITDLVRASDDPARRGELLAMRAPQPTASPDLVPDQPDPEPEPATPQRTKRLAS